ncbi:MAG: hypothetical protein MJD61_16560 [Proteobacteria bacterium]|nr:hypothetical protein [Pseudomonadota bacterium]
MKQLRVAHELAKLWNAVEADGDYIDLAARSLREFRCQRLKVHAWCVHRDVEVRVHPGLPTGKRPEEQRESHSRLTTKRGLRRLKGRIGLERVHQGEL